jgi:hypothetical protein
LNLRRHFWNEEETEKAAGLFPIAMNNHQDHFMGIGFKQGFVIKRIVSLWVTEIDLSCWRVWGLRNAHFFCISSISFKEQQSWVGSIGKICYKEPLGRQEEDEYEESSNKCQRNRWNIQLVLFSLMMKCWNGNRRKLEVIFHWSLLQCIWYFNDFMLSYFIN